MARIRVLIVDDSALVRKMLTAMLSEDPDIEVVGTAPDPLTARERIKQLRPDVLTLDVEMPRMDGLTFLDNLMRLHPMPVVMVSSLTERGAEVTLRALELGAVDFAAKPGSDLTGTFGNSADQIRAKVKVAAHARPRARASHVQPLQVSPRFNADAVLARATGSAGSGGRIIAIGASTGGTEAIRVVLTMLPPDAPPVVITQHIPAQFSAAFAQRMDKCSAMRVCEARDGQPIQAGHVYIAPGDRHLLVVRDGSRHVCRLHDGPLVNRHKPSVDVLFRSVVASIGAAGVGALLTGMGDDGARGLKEMSEAGSATLVQDEATSVVWGMPGVAWNLGAADRALPIEAVAGRLLELATQPFAAPRADRAAAAS
ncbi:MAG TPA: chemotaxis response regulator protein-glutamate methylesterase [Rhodanobacteraceae bacterium]|nr:chemotaxis response regulator protein-glutamate methylesterase [Rhodanobacteraceae bacterium]